MKKTMIGCVVALCGVWTAAAWDLTVDVMTADGRTTQTVVPLETKDGRAVFRMAKETLPAHVKSVRLSAPRWTQPAGTDGYWVNSDGELGTFRARAKDGTRRSARPHMPFFGLVSPSVSFVAIVKGMPFHYSFSVTLKNGAYTPSMAYDWLMDDVYEDLEVEFVDLTGDVANYAGMAEAAFPNDVWGEDGGGARMIPQMGYERSLDLATWGMSMSAGANALRRRQNACYFNTSLNERWVESSRLDGWWWRSAVSTVYDVRPSGTAAYFNLVDACADHAPEIMLNGWLDVNVPTARGRESRRFAAAFCDIPVGEGVPLPSVTGVSAKVFADGRVLLLNDTPCAVAGMLSAKRFGFPLKLVETFGAEGRGTLRIALTGTA